MFRFLHLWVIRRSPHNPQNRHDRPRRWQIHPVIWLLCALCGLGLIPTLASAQTDDLQRQEDQVIREFALPEPAAPPPVYEPPGYEPPAAPPPADLAPEEPEPDNDPSEPPAVAVDRPASQSPTAPESDAPRAIPYVLEFNRSPVVGNRLRLQGVYPETRLGFTRPQNWNVESAQAIIRFQHSPSLLADRSNLVVRVNETSIGSVAFDRPQAQVGQATFNIRANLLQDYNEISFLTEQQTSETCTNSTDPTLWSEILPDSKIIFNVQQQAIPLDFSRYPYPFFDRLGLGTTEFVYLRPKTYSPEWLTAAARFQAGAGRLVDYRPLDTRLETDLSKVEVNERLIVIGTPAEQPALTNLRLTYPLKNGLFVDGKGTPLPGDVGLLLLSTTKDNSVPVLIVTGNAAEGVLRAVQFLVQAQDQKIGTGQAVMVNTTNEVPSPPARNWQGYLPTENEFRLSDLSFANNTLYEDITVHGSGAPPIQIPFHALPDDRFLRGSTMTLDYSYSPQVNPRTSAVEVKLDGTTIGAKGLTSNQGGRETFNVNLPEDLITPTAVLSVNFILNPRDVSTCGLVTDQQLWGTVHGNTGFSLSRDNVVQLPNLRLLQTGYPFTAPQDLSEAAIVLADTPSDDDIRTLLSFSERMGRVSHAESVKLLVYQASSLPGDVRNQQNLVGIGTRDRFPFPEVFQAKGLNLGNQFSRQWEQSQVQTLPDDEGVVKAVMSPWNSDRLVLALTGQTEQGLKDVQDLFDRDSLFAQLRGDTVLISRKVERPSLYDASGYTIQFLEEVQPHRIENIGWFNRLILFLQDNWFILPIGIILLVILLYGFSQLYLNRIAQSQSGDAP
ncbi:MAG: cellulose biosynthesis cyclic di-GMP-binding regulatory protein BcsB [Cyanobacteria bacterium RU_5_0]|nr:cellulose biosynthesis cyclic di-GMP-binding regulatory protein BcsB [Cyanobacteria bacterium RU_5_0]